MYNSNKEFAFKNIKELVEDGIKLMRRDQAGVNAQIWLDYSQKIVELSTRNLDGSIHLNYLRLLLSLQSNHNIPDNQKIQVCLDYLIEVLQLIVDRY